MLHHVMSQWVTQGEDEDLAPWNLAIWKHFDTRALVRTWSDFSRCMICSKGPSSSTNRLRARQTAVSCVTASTEAPLQAPAHAVR